MSLLLLLLIAVPFAGAGIAAMVDSARAARHWALAVCIVTGVIGVALASGFDYKQDLSGVHPGLRLAQSVQIEFPPPDAQNRYAVDDIGFEFRLGVDSVSLFLVLLTVLLMPLAVGASFQSIHQREKEYYAWMLMLLAAMNGVFLARDLLLFYIFFELTLVPMFFIIGIWGGPERRYAAGKFFLFTFGGSIFTLAAVLYLGAKYGTFDIIALSRLAQSGDFTRAALTDVERWWIIMGLLAGFAVKVPLFPVHTWLPLAHTEAPTAGSVILAGVLLKLGTYGLLRLALPLGLIAGDGVAFPGLIKVLGALCIVGIIYGALVAWVQQDIKKLVAYSSVSHLGFCVLGMIALNDIGMQGSVLYMINHGLSTGALFLCVGMIYDRYHTRDINELSGLAKRMPKLAFFLTLFAMSSIGLPGLNGFVSEFLTILGAFTSSHLGIAFGAFAALGVILGAVYMLHMVTRVIWGPLKTPNVHHHPDDPPPTLGADIGGREVAVLVPIALLVVLLGVMPNLVLQPIRGPLELLRTPVVAAPPVRQPRRDAPTRDARAPEPVPVRIVAAEVVDFSMGKE